MCIRRGTYVVAVLIFALPWMYPNVTTAGGSQSTVGEQEPVIPSPENPIWSAQIDFTGPHDKAWNDSDFAILAKSGMNRVEINLNWADIESQKDQYDFQLLDRYMAGAAKAHLKIYLLFWESVWRQNEGKNPPRWITARDISSDGIPADEPPWWDETTRQVYFDYMAHTIDHVKASPGFGGVFADYGWLDSEWGPQPNGSHGVTGYAPEDIQAFYKWLPQTYKTLAGFNHQWQSSYQDWKSIAVPKPGDRFFPVYQRFRHDSVTEVFEAMSRLVRAHTSATLLYYWGGDICGGIGPEVQGNDPDTFFQVAKKYHAIVVLDDADWAGLALLFGSLARSYGVPLLQEWTPRKTGLRAEIPEWLGHIGLAAPMEVGEDFFIYPPPADQPGFAEAWTAYQAWHTTLAKLIQGKTPEQPIAVLVPTRKIALSTDLRAFSGLSKQLRDFWRHHYVLPHFVTDQQVAQGVVRLEQFRAVVDLGMEHRELTELQAYAGKHPVLTNLEQALSYVRPYATVDRPTDSLEVVPTVEGSSVWLTLANCNEQQAYSGTLRFYPQALGLSSATFNVKDVRTGQNVVASQTADGAIQMGINLPPAGFQVLLLSVANPVGHLAGP